MPRVGEEKDEFVNLRRNLRHWKDILGRHNFIILTILLVVIMEVQKREKETFVMLQVKRGGWCNHYKSN